MHQTQGHPSTLKKTLIALVAQIDHNTVRVGELNSPLSSMDR
jgi:hypothetical protein